jgi:hypothetical protein
LACEETGKRWHISLRNPQRSGTTSQVEPPRAPLAEVYSSGRSVRWCSGGIFAGAESNKSSTATVLWIFPIRGSDLNAVAIPRLLLSQANGRACVDFGCTHPIDGLFWSLPIYLLGFFSKYESCITYWFNHVSISILFLSCHLFFFVLWDFISLWNVENNSYH